VIARVKFSLAERLRGTRLFEPDKLWFTILDYAGATRLFFDPDFDGDPELVEIEPLTPEVPAEPATPDSTSVVQACPCQALSAVTRRRHSPMTIFLRFPHR